MNIVSAKSAETEVHAPVKQKQEYKRVGSIMLKKGLKLYQYNFVKEELKLVEINKFIKLDTTGKVVKQNKAQHDDNCIYVQALNDKNAARKIIKLMDNAFS
ncbi:MAG: hypothetical protein QM503_03845 [Bacteroidota bacterium]